MRNLRSIFFKNQKYFEIAIEGMWIKSDYGEEYLKIPAYFGADPEMFFMNHLQSLEIYPIEDYYEEYSEDKLFSVIEILYDKISSYNDEYELEIEKPRNEFAIQINNILKFYNSGYYLETNSGTICKDTNNALKKMLSEDLAEVISSDIMEKMHTAIKIYYRFNSTLELKKKAISILADILEPLRNDLKNNLNDIYDISKNNHDKLIFDIVNNFDVRHNNSKQNTNYEKDIWYDWMMQYYTSVIVTYYKLEKKSNNIL